jgi:hypothetical protein
MRLAKGTENDLCGTNSTPQFTTLLSVNRKPTEKGKELMTNLPAKIISLETAMKRWGMSLSDVFLIAHNHGLRPVYRDVEDWKYWDEREEGDWIDLFDQRKEGTSKIFFMRSEVGALEKRIGGPITKSLRVINEEDLLQRWDISKVELWSVVEERNLEPVDPLGVKIEDFAELDQHLLRYQLYDEIKCYFQLSDIEQIEKEHKIEPKTPGSQKHTKLRPNQWHNLRSREVAKELWKKDPKITIADMIMRDEIAAACDGRLYNEKTLRKWIKDLCPDRLPGRRRKTE